MTTSKGYGNYMSKKFFHPTNPVNLKKIYIAKEKAKFEKKKQDDMIKQYLSEQDQLEHRATLGDEKAKMGLSFMYDAPPGLHKDHNAGDQQEEKDVKFEWQRKFQAPRESYIKSSKDVIDNPFGIHVSNVKCIRCLKWGHLNTDSVCPLYKQNITLEPPNSLMSGSDMTYVNKNVNGYKLKSNAYSHFKYADQIEKRKGSDKSKHSKGKQLPSEIDRNLANNDNDDEAIDEEEMFLNSLTEDQRRKMFSKIESMKEKQKDTKN
ncbi:MAG: putative electron transfer flavoprotein subunit [Marteilia pararefringens]